MTSGMDKDSHISPGEGQPPGDFFYHLLTNFVLCSYIVRRADVEIDSN